MNGKKAVFVAKYLETGNIAGAARAAGIGESTAHRWLNNGLRAEFEKLQGETISAAVKGLQSSISGATGFLKSVVDDEKADIRDRLRAAENLLRYGVQMYEAGNAERLEALINEIEGMK